MNWHLFDRIVLAFVAGLWLWKLVEFGSRRAGWLGRNLGWGFYVDFTIPVVATVAFLSILAIRKLVRLRNGASNMKCLLLLISSVLCLFGQVDANSLHTKYGEPVEETFTVRPGITVSVVYGNNHQVCKLDIRPSRNDSAIPAALIEDILNEIVPASTRGTPGRQGVDCTGFCWKVTEYERMHIGQAAHDTQPSHTSTQSQNSVAVVQFKSCEAIKR